MNVAEIGGGTRIVGRSPRALGKARVARAVALLGAALLVGGCAPKGGGDSPPPPPPPPLQWQGGRPGLSFGVTQATEGRPFVVGGVSLCTAGRPLTLGPDARFTEGALTVQLRTRPGGPEGIGSQPGTFASLGLEGLGRTVTAPCGGSAFDELLMEASWTGPVPAYGRGLTLSYTDDAGIRGGLVIPFTLGLCPGPAASGCPSPPA